MESDEFVIGAVDVVAITGETVVTCLEIATAREESIGFDEVEVAADLENVEIKDAIPATEGTETVSGAEDVVTEGATEEVVKGAMVEVEVAGADEQVTIAVDNSGVVMDDVILEVADSSVLIFSFTHGFSAKFTTSLLNSANFGFAIL